MPLAGREAVSAARTAASETVAYKPCPARDAMTSAQARRHMIHVGQTDLF